MKRLKHASIGILCLAIMGYGTPSTARDKVDTKFTTSHKTKGISDFSKDLYTCRSAKGNVPPRGEYETREEYRARIAKLEVDCSAYTFFSGVETEIPVNLQYDVDNELFLFTFPEHRQVEITYDLLRDRSPSILYPESFSEYDDFPPPEALDQNSGLSCFNLGNRCYRLYRCCEYKLTYDEHFFYKIELPETTCAACYHPKDMQAHSKGCSIKKDSPWLKQVFTAVPIDFWAYAKPPMARELKIFEQSLVIRLTGDLDVEKRKFMVKRMALVNRENNHPLIVFEDFPENERQAVVEKVRKRVMVKPGYYQTTTTKGYWKTTSRGKEWIPPMERKVWIEPVYEDILVEVGK